MQKQKKTLRAEYLRQRNRFSPAALALKSRKISSALLRFDAVQKAQNIFSYINCRSEVMTLPLLKTLMASGKKILAPKVNMKKHGLEFYEIRDLRRGFKKGPYGIPEPADCAKSSAPKKGDVVLVPGAAFDRRGLRMGYGKGYYDNFLAGVAKGAVTIGLCYNALFVYALPHEPHDARVQFIATEKGIYETQKIGAVKTRRKSQGVKNGRRKKHTKRAA